MIQPHRSAAGTCSRPAHALVRRSRKVLCAVLLVSATLAAAPLTPAQQQGHPVSDWARVQALVPGVAVDVRATNQHLHCRVSSVTEDALACTPASAPTPTVLRRSEIRAIKVRHRSRSALIGAGVGGGGLAIGFFAATTNQGGFFGPNFLRGPATGVGAVVGGLLGGGIGALTDFSRTTIYRAP